MAEEKDNYMMSVLLLRRAACRGGWRGHLAQPGRSFTSIPVLLTAPDPPTFR